MNTPSRSTPDRSTVIKPTRRRTTCKKSHRPTPKAPIGRIVLNETPVRTGRCCRRRAGCLRGLSPVLWRDIEKCVEDRRRTCRGARRGEVRVRVTRTNTFRMIRSRSHSRRRRRRPPLLRLRNAILSHGKCHSMSMILYLLQAVQR